MKAGLAMDPIPLGEATEYLDAYLAEKIDKGSAVLITGNWGSGKTEFISRYFSDRQKNHQGQLPPLTASFFGAHDEAAIADQFLSQLYPSLNSKIGKVLGTAAFRMGNRLLSAQLGGDVLEYSDVDAVRNWAANPKDRVVVFDDLERSTFGVDRALSLINGYVETDGLRVIVLANEAEVGSGRYTRWKEKVVGKSLYIRADPMRVIEAVAHELPHGSVKGYLRRNAARVAEVLQAGGEVNYRSFKALMGDADRLVSRVDGRLGTSPKGLESVVLFSIGVGSEFRAGSVTASEVSKMGRDFQRHVKQREKWDERDVHLDVVEKRYRGIGAYEPVVPPGHLAMLWSSGAIQVDEINSVLALDPIVVGAAAAPAWRKMWDMFSMNRNQYESARRELIADLESGRILKFGELLHVIGISVVLEKWGVLLVDGLRTLQWLEEYLQREDVSVGLEEADSRYSVSESYGSLGYHRRESEEFKRAALMVVSTASNAALARAASMVPTYVAQIESDDYSSIHAFGVGNLAPRSVPWLQHADPEWLARVLISDGLVARQLLTALAARYEGDYDALLRNEWLWIRSFRVQIRRTVMKLPAPQRQICTALIRRDMVSIRTYIVRAARASKATSASASY